MNHTFYFGMLSLAWNVAASPAQSLRGEIFGPDGKPCADARVFVKCNRLHVDMSGLIALIAEQSKTLWSSGYLETHLTGKAPNYVAPVFPGLFGVPFTCQTAWTETVTKATQLTAASLTYFPTLPPIRSSSAVQRKGLHLWSDVGGKPVFAIDSVSWSNPICWYE